MMFEKLRKPEISIIMALTAGLMLCSSEAVVDSDNDGNHDSQVVYAPDGTIIHTVAPGSRTRGTNLNEISTYEFCDGSSLIIDQIEVPLELHIKTQSIINSSVCVDGKFRPEDFQTIK